MFRLYGCGIFLWRVFLCTHINIRFKVLVGSHKFASTIVFYMLRSYIIVVRSVNLGRFFSILMLYPTYGHILFGFQKYLLDASALYGAICVLCKNKNYALSWSVLLKDCRQQLFIISVSKSFRNILNFIHCTQLCILSREAYKQSKLKVFSNHLY